MTNEFGVEVEHLVRQGDETPYAFVVYCPHWNEVLTPSAYFRCLAAANKDDFFARVRAEVSEAAKFWAINEANSVVLGENGLIQIEDGTDIRFTNGGRIKAVPKGVLVGTQLSLPDTGVGPFEVWETKSNNLAGEFTTREEAEDAIEASGGDTFVVVENG